MLRTLARWLVGNPIPVRVFCQRHEIADETGIRNECTSGFFERFEGAFLAEAIDFVDAVRERQALRLTLDNAAEATRRDVEGGCIE